MSKVELSNYGYTASIVGSSGENFKEIKIWKGKDMVADYCGHGSFMELKEEVMETMKNNLSDLLDRCKISEEINETKHNKTA
jgi:hypothetical protein